MSITDWAESRAELWDAYADLPDPPDEDETEEDDALADMACDDCRCFAPCPCKSYCGWGWCTEYEEHVDGSTPVEQCDYWE